METAGRGIGSPLAMLGQSQLSSFPSPGNDPNIESSHLAGIVGNHRAVVLLATLLLGASRPVSAQHIRGTIRDSAGGQPVAGAVVSVTDSAGHTLARSIGDAAGGYAVFRMSGSVRLHVVHIGYRPRDLRIGASLADSIVDLRMESLPPTLGVVRTSTTRVCPGDNDGGDALELWQQARAALLASVVSREASGPRIQLLAFKRTLEPVQRRVKSQTWSSKHVVADRSYAAARPPWQLAAQGYMQEELGGERTFYAPDEEVLLDASFADTHCLHVVANGGDAHSNDIGLGFDPVHSERRDTLVDVSGVLWIDRNLSALHSLEFHYTALEPAADRSGGEITFRTMPNGAPMIVTWTIRSTVLAVDQPLHPEPVQHRRPDRPDRHDVTTVAYQEQGGVLASVEWPDGKRWHADLPRVTGVVVDSARNAVEGARIWMLDMPDTATSDADGRFALPYVLPGIYTVVASDSLLATQGVSRTIPITIALRGLAMAGDSHVQLHLHPRAEVFPLVCPAKSYRPGTGVVMARVMNSDGTPVPNARVEVLTSQAVVAKDTITRAVKRAAESDENGRFVVCGASRDQTLVVQASSGELTAVSVVDRWPDEVVTITLTVKPPGR